MNFVLPAVFFIFITLFQDVFTAIRTHVTKKKEPTKKELKLETACEIDEMISDASRITENCKIRCNKQLKGYINHRDELVCYSEKLKAERISPVNKPCTCGHKPSKNRAPQYCEPNVHFDNITNESECKNKCDEYTVLRLRKYHGPLAVIYCEKEFDPQKITDLAVGFEKLSGTNPDNPDFKCLCGLEDKKINPYIIKNPVFLDIESLKPSSNREDFATTCFKGPFPTEPRSTSCGTFCAMAKAFFLPNNDLICYHDTVTAVAMPPFSRTPKANVDFLNANLSSNSKITCTCGAPFMLDYKYESPCIPEIKLEIEKHEQIPVFKNRCASYCATFEAYFVDSYWKPTVLCISKRQSRPHTRVIKLDSDILSYNGPPQIVPLIQCQCGLHRSNGGFSPSHSTPSNQIQRSNSLDVPSSSNDRIRSQRQMKSYKMASYRVPTKKNYFKNKKKEQPMPHQPEMETTIQPDSRLNKPGPAININSPPQTRERESLSRQFSFDLNPDAINALEAMDELMPPILSPRWSLSSQNNYRGFHEIMPISPGDYHVPLQTCEHRIPSTGIFQDIAFNEFSSFNVGFDEFSLNAFDELQSSSSPSSNHQRAFVSSPENAFSSNQKKRTFDEIIPIDYHPPSPSCNHRAEFNDEFELGQFIPDYNDILNPDLFHAVNSSSYINNVLPYQSPTHSTQSSQASNPQQFSSYQMQPSQISDSPLRPSPHDQLLPGSSLHPLQPSSSHHPLHPSPLNHSLQPSPPRLHNSQPSSSSLTTNYKKRRI